MKTKLFTLLLAVAAGVGAMSAAITVRLDPSSCSSWSTVRLWAWTDEGNLFDSWPGQIVSLDGDGWYSYTFDEDITSVSIIWNNGTYQTVDIEGVTSSTCYALNSTSGKAITVSVVNCSSGSSQGETPVSGKYKIGDLYYNLDGNNLTAVVTKNNYSGSIVIPSSVTYNNTTYSVTSIGDRAFYNCSGLTSVTIGNSVTSIGDRAFYNCSGLTSVTIGNSVTSIADYAFYGCTGLTSLTIPSSVTNIENHSFTYIPNIVYHGDAIGSPWGARSINGYIDGFFVFNDESRTELRACYTSAIGEITIPNSVTSIGSNAFYDCKNLTSITIPNSVTSMGDGAFYGCTGLTSITIPSSVTNISNYALRECSGLISVTIPNSATYIGKYAFCNCRSLTSITIPNSVTSIGEYAFLGCDNLPIYENIRYADTYLITVVDKTLSSYTIKEGTRFIGSDAFSGCSNMTSIYIPNSVISIGYEAFRWTGTNLTSVTIGNGVKSIGARAFACKGLTSVVWNAVACTGINTDSFEGAPITSFVIGDSVKHLPTGLCSNMKNLSSVHISDIAAWCSITFGSSKTANPLNYAHHLYLNNEEIINLVIPEGVTEISNRAFVGYTAMKTVSIPSTVVRIGHTAFDGCTGLTSVVIPDGVTEIGNQAFMRCSNLQHVSIGDNVISIGSEVFKGCTSLITPIYNSHTFFVMPTSYSGAYIIPDGIENVIGSAFYQCNGLTSINIPNSVKLIGEEAFRECSNLAEITIGTGVSALGRNVFNKCANIKKVQWNAINYRQAKPNNDSNCFPFYSSRDSINSFIFGEDVEYIPEYLLKDFSAIHSLIIPASVKEIAKYAFANDSLTEMTCLAEIPPTIDSTAVAGVNKSTCILYVPYASMNAYRNADVWKEFVNIRAIGAEEVEEPEDDIVITPSNTTASIIWALISNAVSYELVIRDMNGNVICTLTFNAYGQLTGIAFAPNRNRQAQQTQVAGFQFTVSGLENGTTYEYEFNAKDENDIIIETFTGTFTTTNDTPTSVENTPENMLNVPKKVMYNNQIFILRGDKVYTLQGQEVR